MTKKQEDKIERSENGTELKAQKVKKESVQHQPETNPKAIEWNKSDNIRKWAMTEPRLGDVDLRPYFFACKGKQDYFFNQIKSENLRNILDRLMSTSMNIAGVRKEVKDLSDEDARIIFDNLSSKIMAQSNISEKPKGIEGIVCLVSLHQKLEYDLMSLIEMFNTKTVGVWICSGWNECIKSEAAKSRLSSYVDKLKVDGSAIVKAAASTI
jgi:hypothetical protein